MSQITQISQGGGGGAQAFIQQVFNMDSQPVYLDNNVALPMSYSDTIPQSNQGVEVITVGITPTDATNILCIRFEAFAAGGEEYATVALFQDAGVNAIAARNVDTRLIGSQMLLTHFMTAGTLNPITFRIRYGVSTSMTGDTTTINGDSDLEMPVYGGVSSMVIYVQEMLP